MNNLKVVPKLKTMSNTSSLTEKSPKFFNFQRGDIVEAYDKHGEKRNIEKENTKEEK